MTTIAAGTQVKKGYYFSMKSWTLQPVAADGAALPGAAGEPYLRVPLLLAFAVAPVMGSIFFSLVALHTLGEVLLYIGLALALVATVMYARYGAEQVHARRESQLESPSRPPEHTKSFICIPT